MLTKKTPKTITLKQQLTEAQAHIERLKAGYQECIEDVQDWSGYASEYFRDKYNLSATIEEHKKIISQETKQSLAEHDAEVIEEFSGAMNKIGMAHIDDETIGQYLAILQQANSIGG